MAPTWAEFGNRRLSGHGQNLLVNPFVLNGGSLATQGVSVDYSGPLTITGGTTSYLGDYVNGAGTITLGGTPGRRGTVNTIGGVSITLSGATSGFAGTWAAMNNTATANVSTNFVGNANGSPGATWTTSNADFGINNSGVVNFGALSGSSGTIQNGVASTSSTLSVSACGANTTYGGLITNGAGTLGLTVNGPGTLTLTNSEKYTGVTTVNGEELIVAGSLSTSSSPPSTAGRCNTATGPHAEPGHQRPQQLHAHLRQRRRWNLREPDFRRRHGGHCRPRQCFARYIPGLYEADDRRPEARSPWAP